MNESDNNNFDLPGESSHGEKFPWGVVIIGVVVFAVALFFIFRSKSENASREAVVAMMEKDLDTDKAALDAQKEKVVQLTQQLEGLKIQIQSGQAKDKKKAVADYNAMAKEQNAARDQYIQLANKYNEKVAKLHQLQ